MSRAIVCPRCRHLSRARRRSGGWWVALAAMGATFTGMILGASLLGPLITMVLPLLATVGFALGPLHTLAREVPTCARCGRVLTVPATERERRAPVPTAAAA